MVTTFHALKNLDVVDAGGLTLGHVVDVELDADEWKIKALIVRLERSVANRLGLHRLIGNSDLALKIVYVHALGDTVLLRDSLDDLARIAPEASAEAEHVRH
jgi:sporulation protein YlmC with PRC-barrel domain